VWKGHHHGGYQNGNVKVRFSNRTTISASVITIHSILLNSEYKTILNGDCKLTKGSLPTYRLLSLCEICTLEPSSFALGTPSEEAPTP